MRASESDTWLAKNIYVTIAGDRRQEICICLAPMAAEQEGIFIVPYPLWHKALVFAVSFEGPPQGSRLYRQARCTVELLMTPIKKLFVITLINNFWFFFLRNTYIVSNLRRLRILLDIDSSGLLPYVYLHYWNVTYFVRTFSVIMFAGVTFQMHLLIVNPLFWNKQVILRTYLLLKKRIVCFFRNLFFSP